MLGAGEMGAGGPAGVGETEDAMEPSLDSGGSRFINPITSDYQFDAVRRNTAQMPPTRQRVLLALVTQLESSTALRRIGTNRPDRMGDRFESEQTQDVQRALQHLVDDGIIIEGISVERGAAGRARTTVAFEGPEGRGEVTV